MHSVHPVSPLAASRCALSQRQRAVRAFSLIELMVVVGIIVLLVGLTVSVSVILNQQSETRQVEMTMEILDKALTEWETAAERTITYDADGQPPNAVYDIANVAVADGHELTHFIVEILNKNEAAKSLLAGIDQQFLRLEGGDELTIFDPWEKDFVAIFPGRLALPGEPRDKDGTIITPFEAVFGSCANRKICFVSAGPDGNFGDISAAATTPAYKATLDNIYSYPLEMP